MIKAGIAGATGYAGIELVKLISNHPELRLTSITSNSYKGKSLTDVFPSMRGFESFVCEDLNIKALSKKIDVLFLALPHKVSMQYVPQLLDHNIKVIDLSADFRFSDPAIYESAYQKHTSKLLLAKSVYGLCEIYQEKIRQASLIGNPGCYPTSILLPLIPLLKEKLIGSDNIICDSKSGVSGAGRSLSLATHYCEANESFTPYKVGNHRHTPEINEKLTIHSQEKVDVVFVPHLLPLTRGMLSTMYVKSINDTNEDRIREIYDSYYGDKPFVRILDKGIYPAISHVKGTNCCDIGIHFNADSGQVIIVSAIDNLIKGAAGQAVQNMNLIFDFPEETGLNFVQTPL
ncbi:MAG: N-acetyl-gamma-glutamyl-phosphate reductase [Desulfobacula sp.]|nr:N-acetyl-gamma-glutamyl-phosphate reductase [Desulfobacula sp.]